MTSMQFRVLSSALAALEVWYRARSQDFITCQISIWYSPRLYRTHCLKYSHELISLAPRPLPLCCSLCVYNIARPFFEQEKPKNWGMYWNEAIELLSSQDGIYSCIVCVCSLARSAFWLFLMHKLSAWLLYSKYEHKSLCRFHPQCCFYLGTQILFILP